MIRGAFSNLQLKNFMVPGVEGGVDTSARWRAVEHLRCRHALPVREKPLIVIAGENTAPAARD
jgi:hypothetical protein